MKKRNKLGFLLVLIFLTQHSFAQDTLRLAHDEFMAIVKRYHPLAFRYKLQNNIAEADVLSARGSFDPIIGAKDGSKTIDGQNYYREKNVGVTIPTWYGVALNGSYNYLQGQKLDNSATRGGLYQFGLSVPLAKGLIYDQRRALLEQAKFAVLMTSAEQQLLTNELFRDAETAYWQWVRYYEIYTLQTKAVDINVRRLSMIKKTYEYGEQAAIDTTEALSQLRGFELQQQEAYLQYVKATMELSLFLWKDNLQPYDISQPIFPKEQLTSSDAYASYSSLIQQLYAQNLNSHLSVIYYQQKLNILESERRLKWQSFLPKVDFVYNFFNKEGYRADHFPLFENNYQYGLKLEIPVFLRQARGDYRIAKLKITQNKIDINFKQQELNTKISNYSNEVLNYRGQIDLADQNIANYQRLLQGEEAKLGNGESSLFLINSRENKLIEAQEKLIELRFKFIKGFTELRFLTSGFIM
ncbi:TolC family protein [Arcticibacter eurypsychrophilus]|uniref:TolC family protein n=1 Tax=Arcticibacter eurypsychrophilus TaxID=1434752 RepID=UPI00084D3ED9|nr:TolC family protein [Arcticibacter eurypsychrophilus]